jgi:large subunit ribosomal protein L23
MLPEHIIKRPILLTEKAARLRENESQVVFEVDRRANKIEIKKAVETLFNVNVRAVNTSIVRGRERRMGKSYGRLTNWKKAVVTLEKGQDIQFFEEEGASE